MDADFLGRNMASATFAGAILGDRGSRRPLGGEPALAALPVDDTPWVLGTVLFELQSPITDKPVVAPFYFLVADLEIVSIEAVVGVRPSAEEAVAVLFEAMHAPLMGEPRRPRQVVVADERLVEALRRASARDHAEMSDLMEFVVGRTDDDAEVVLSFLEVQRSAVAEDERDVRGAGQTRRPA